jgi:ParB-like nuclease domain.
MWERPPQPIIRNMLMTGSYPIDAERAFARARRTRRRAAIARMLHREPAERGRLKVYDERKVRRSGAQLRGIREIPIDAIDGTLEPGKAAQFDGAFRPAAAAETRWQRVWIAEQRGDVLPPISVVPTDDGYAVRDGHHRVSVARARGATTIDAEVLAA